MVDEHTYVENREYELIVPYNEEVANRLEHVAKYSNDKGEATHHWSLFAVYTTILDIVESGIEITAITVKENIPRVLAEIGVSPKDIKTWEDEPIKTYVAYLLGLCKPPHMVLKFTKSDLEKGQT